jgi:hypothetical protein
MNASPQKALILYCPSEPNVAIPHIDQLTKMGCSGSLLLESENKDEGKCLFKNKIEIRETKEGGCMCVCVCIWREALKISQPCFIVSLEISNDIFQILGLYNVRVLNVHACKCRIQRLTLFFYYSKRENKEASEIYSTR